MKHQKQMPWTQKNTKEPFTDVGGFKSLVEWKSPSFASVLLSPKLEYNSLAYESIFDKDYFSFFKDEEVKDPLERSSSWTSISAPSPPVTPCSSPKTKKNSVKMQSNDKKSQLENHLNYNQIVRGLDKRTTFMIKNIPNKYSQEMLIDFLNETHKGTFDFLYLRIDFKNKCNVGYAFINFPNPMSALTLADRIVGKKW